MATVWLTLRADLRHRWRTLAALALLLGLIGGVVLAAAAGARRTDTAYPRLMAWSNASQLDVVVPQFSDSPGYYAALARLPQVESAALGQLDQAALPGDQATAVQLASSPDTRYGTRIDRVRVLAGRLFDPRAAGQAMIDQTMAAAEHLGPGGTVRVLVVPNDPVTNIPDFAKAVPVAFLVTAVVAFDPQFEIADGGYNSPTVLASAPFAATPVACAASYGTEAAVRLKPGASVPQFTAAANTLAGRFADPPGTGGRPTSPARPTSWPRLSSPSARRPSRWPPSRPWPASSRWPCSASCSAGSSPWTRPSCPCCGPSGRRAPPWSRCPWRAWPLLPRAAR